MATVVRLPMRGQSMEEGTITKWYKSEGEQVKSGELLLEMMTDKANIEIEAEVEGFVRKLLVAEDATVPVQAPIAIIGTADEDISAALAEAASGEPPAPGDGKSEDVVASVSASTSAPVGAKGASEVFLSPRARKLAEENGIVIAELAGRGTGPEGRVVEKDIEGFLKELSARPKMTPVAAKMAADMGVNAADLTGSGAGGRITKGDLLQKAQPATPAVVVAPVTPSTQSVSFSGRRKLTADAVTRSYQNVPHVTLISEVDVTELVALREQILPQFEKEYGVRVSYTDILVKALGQTIRKFPAINATLAGDQIQILGDINVNVAVAMNGALMIPVVRNADVKTLSQIALELRGLIERARNGKSGPDDLSGGTFTITNLGNFGVDAFTPILTPGQAGILGVGRIIEKPVVVNHQVVIRSMLGISLSFDHRIVDGAPAGEFLKALMDTLKTPVLMLI